MKATINLCFIMVLTLSNCSSLITYTNNKVKEGIKRNKIDGYFKIHKNPQMGDYSILYWFEKNIKVTKMYIQINDLDKEFYSVLRRFNDSKPMKIGCCTFGGYSLFTYELANYEFAYIIDKNGKVIKADIIDPKTRESEKIELSDRKRDVETDNEIYSIQTEAGSFNCRMFWYKDGTESNEKYTVEFISDEVNFLTVRGITLQKDKFLEFLTLTKDQKSDYKPWQYFEIVKQGRVSQ